MRSSRVSTPSSSASPERFGAASLSSSSLLLDAGVLSSTRSAAASPALLASLLLSSLLLSSLLLLLLLLEAGGGGGGGAFLSFLRFFASLEASLSLFLPIVDAAARCPVALRRREHAVHATAADAPQASKLGCHEYSGKRGSSCRALVFPRPGVLLSASGCKTL